MRLSFTSIVLLCALGPSGASAQDARPQPGALPDPLPNTDPAASQALIDFDADITVRTDATSGDVITEHWQNGVIDKVHVQPDTGPEYMLLDTDGDGRLDAVDGEHPRPRPVFWDSCDWE